MENRDEMAVLVSVGNRDKSVAVVSAVNHAKITLIGGVLIGGVPFTGGISCLTWADR